MTKKTKKLLWILFSFFMFNWLLIMIGWSPFGWHYFFPDYYDDVKYWAPAWLDNDHIVFMKSVNNWRQETGFLFSDGRRFMEYKTFLCSMKIDGTDKRELLEIPKEFGSGYISYGNGIIVLSNGSNEKGKIGVLNLSTKEFNIIASGGEAVISFDGKQIAYIGQGESSKIIREHIHGNDIVQTSYGNNGIWQMDTDGKNKIQLTDNPGDTHPLWSPDGTMVAFERNIERKGKEIWVMGKDGNGQRKVLDFPYFTQAHTILFGWFNNGKSLWTYKGKIDLEGNIIKSYDVDQGNERVIGVISPDNAKFVNAAYFPKRSVDKDRVFFVGDLDGNRIYEEINYATIAYGKSNRKQKNDIWIKE